MNIKNNKNSFLFEVKVKPNSSKFKIDLDKKIIYCKSPAKQNKANLEIIKNLEKFFNTKVQIIAGLRQKHKKILIHNITKESFEKMIKCQ